VSSTRDPLRSEVVIEKPGAISLRVGENDGVCRLAVPTLVVEQEDRKSLTIEFLPFGPR